MSNGAIDVNAADYCHPNYELGVEAEDKLETFIITTLNRSATFVCTDETNPGG
jgi:hypothetical protein